MAQSRVTPAEAEANAASIRALWQIGRACQTHLDKRKSAAFTYGSKAKVFEQEAERLEVNVDTVKKARRLAQQYTRDDVSEICKLVVKHSSTFAAANMLAILSIVDRDRRNQVMKQAIRESWSFSRLKQAIQGMYRSRRRAKGGRKPHVPSDRVARLVALDAITEKWCRWCTTALPQLPASLRERVERAVKAARNVQRAVAAKLKRPK